MAPGLGDLKDVSTEDLTKLKDLGITKIEDLIDENPADIASITGIDLKKVRQWISEARQIQGLPPKQTGYTMDRKEEVKRLKMLSEHKSSESEEKEVDKVKYTTAFLVFFGAGFNILLAGNLLMLLSTAGCGADVNCYLKMIYAPVIIALGVLGIFAGNLLIRDKKYWGSVFALFNVITLIISIGLLEFLFGAILIVAAGIIGLVRDYTLRVKPD